MADYYDVQREYDSREHDDYYDMKPLLSQEELERRAESWFELMEPLTEDIDEG